MFGAAVKSAGVQAEERLVEADAGVAQQPAGALAHVQRNGHRRNLVDDARRIHRGEQHRVVVELMAARRIADGRRA